MIQNENYAKQPIPWDFQTCQDTKASTTRQTKTQRNDSETIYKL